MIDFLRQHWRPMLFGLCVLVAVLTLAYRVLAGVVRGAVLAVRKPKELGQSGAAAAEFVIVVIPFLLMLFALMQLSLASLARVLVSYSAFAAARAAVVIIPMQPDEVSGFKAKVGSLLNNEQKGNIGYGANTRTDFAVSHKAALIRNAAAYPLIPASPSIDIVVQDTMNNWGKYFENRLKYGLDPRQYLDMLVGDIAAVPAALREPFADILKDSVKDGINNSAERKAAQEKLDAWIDSKTTDPKQREELKKIAGGYLDKIGEKGGGWAQQGINDTLAGPLEKFRDEMNQGLGPLAPAGGAPGSFKGAAVDRALDVGFGAGTDGAGGAILRSLRKLVYARMGTVVTLHDAAGNFKTKFDWNEPIRAKVTHLFYCQIPLANRFAGKPFYGLADGTVADMATGPMKGISIVGIPGYFLAMSAEHTLTNQGKP
jgi:hypothetical protein